MKNESFKDQCSDMTKTFRIQIPCKLAERVEAYASANNTTHNSVVIEALDSFLRNQTNVLQQVPASFMAHTHHFYMKGIMNFLNQSQNLVTQRDCRKSPNSAFSRNSLAIISDTYRFIKCFFRFFDSLCRYHNIFEPPINTVFQDQSAIQAIFDKLEISKILEQVKSV